MKKVTRYEVRLDRFPCSDRNFSTKGKLFPRRNALKLIKILKAKGHNVYLSSPVQINV